LSTGRVAGLIRNYEVLLARARGEFVFLADQDDIWLPEKVDTMVAHLENADLVISDCTVTDADLAGRQPLVFRAPPLRTGAAAQSAAQQLSGLLHGDAPRSSSPRASVSGAVADARLVARTRR
jgi:hypothetical protein